MSPLRFFIIKKTYTIVKFKDYVLAEKSYQSSEPYFLYVLIELYIFSSTAFIFSKVASSLTFVFKSFISRSSSLTFLIFCFISSLFKNSQPSYPHPGGTIAHGDAGKCLHRVNLSSYLPQRLSSCKYLQ